MSTSLYEPVTLEAGTTARTATGQGDPVRVLESVDKPVSAVIFMLVLTDAKTGSGDKLDAFVQARLDRTNWINIVHFTQVLGNGADDLLYVAKVSASAAQAMFEKDTTLAADAIRNLLAEDFRAAWTITDAGGHVQSFTFKVLAIPV